MLMSRDHREGLSEGGAERGLRRNPLLRDSLKVYRNQGTHVRKGALDLTQNWGIY